MNAQQYQVMRVVEKIPLFKGLEVQEVARLLKVCHPCAYKPGQTVYSQGDLSDEMLILLKGKLSVTGPAGEVLANLPPGSSTGEMGLFTGQPRSASIVAVESSAGFVIRKAELITMLSNQKDMHVKLLYNLVGQLSQRLAEANRMNEKLMGDNERLEDLSAGRPPVVDEEEDEEYLEEEEDDEDADSLDYDGSGS